jgi:pectinesterase inhibitor-like protein
MNPSKLSLFFTLCLIFISQAHGGCLFEGLCAATGQGKDRCLQLLKDDPEIASAKTDLDLCKLVLKFGLKKATEAQNYLKELGKTNPSPAIQQCATFHYDGVIGSFKSSLGELVEDSMTSNYDAKVAGDGTMGCDTALAKANINDPTITALNKEVSLISIVAYFATNKLP